MIHLFPQITLNLPKLISKLLPAVLTVSGAWAAPVLAAERVYVTYGLLERSVSVDSLDTFVQEGKISAELSDFTRFFNEEQLEELQNILAARIELSPVSVDRFLYTNQGEALLEQLGSLIRTRSGNSGFHAIRAALILAAGDEEGLTPLNVLKQFPLTEIRVNLPETLEILGQLEDLVNQTSSVVALIEQQSALAAAATAIDFSELPDDLRFPGSFTSQMETIVLVDISRERKFKADIYLPNHATGDRIDPAPVIIISHGLGSDRTSYRYLARHLASHGFVVAVPDHPGSDAALLEALFEGRASEVSNPREFIDRPLDIKQLLDQLSQMATNDAIYQGRLNLDQVAVVGQSFGGYTALVLAGAPINFSQLENDCNNPSPLNLSYLLQCRALEIPRELPSLQDGRVKAILVINPIGSSVLGADGFSQIDIPVMVLTGNGDTIAPSLLEQVYPFTWLTTSDRYLLLLQGTTHFSTIGESQPGNIAVDLPPEVVGPDPNVARAYVNIMSLAFLQTYINNERTYLPYLSSGYARYISQTPVPLHLVNRLTPDQLSEALSITLVKTSSKENSSRILTQLD
jgi:predicted dienelactone hydrolase